ERRVMRYESRGTLEAREAGESDARISRATRGWPQDESLPSGAPQARQGPRCAGDGVAGMSEEKPPKCSQCNNQAYVIGSGPPLCVECFSKLPVEVPKPTRVAIIALNFGIVQYLDASITSIHARGDEDVAGALAKLMQAVLDSRDLAREAKSAVLEQVGYLATQAAERAAKRQKAVSKLVIDSLKTTLG